MEWHAGPVPEEIFQEYCANVERMEKSGELDNLFKGSCVEHRDLPTKEKLLNSISSDMRLFRSTFTKIYGCEISYPGFAEIALTKLEEIGCVKAREHYKRTVSEYEEKHEEDMKNVAQWIKGQEFVRKGSVDLRRKQREAEQRKADLRQKSDSELLTLLQKLSAENDL